LSGCISIRRTRPLAVDEKSHMQALDRSAPMLPMMPGVPGRQIHDYVRYGTTTGLAQAAEPAEDRHRSTSAASDNHSVGSPLTNAVLAS
jgi:hypothetical protein